MSSWHTSAGAIQTDVETAIPCLGDLPERTRRGILFGLPLVLGRQC
jgi:hypothetical protein